jgi:hypothetical protein
MGTIKEIYCNISLTLTINRNRGKQNMKTAPQLISQFLTLIFAISITAFCYSSVFAQNNADSENDKIPPPEMEEFKKVSGLVLPFVDSGCSWQSRGKVPTCSYILIGSGNCQTEFFNEGVYVGKLPNCYEITKEERVSGDRDITSIYNDDGSLWFRFSNIYSKPNYYKNNTEIGFLPFATTWSGLRGGTPVLRLVGESQNWYEVEVNEENWAIKYISKKDSNWTKISWEYLLGKEYFLSVKDRTQNRLRDKPNGEIIEESASLFFHGFAYLNKTDGDWVFVKGVNLQEKQSSKEYQGWIRWRENGKLLFYISSIAITQVNIIKNNRPTNGPDRECNN